MNDTSDVIELVISGALLLATICAALVGEHGLALLFGLPCVAVVVAGAARTYGLLHPLSIVLAVSGAYVVAGPIELIMFSFDLVVSDAPMTALLAYGASFLVFGRFAGALVANAHRRGATTCSRLDEFDLGTVWLATAASLAVALALISTYGIEIGSITRAELYANEQAGLSAARVVAAAFVVVAFGQLRSRPARPVTLTRLASAAFGVAVAAFVSTELLILGDRRLLLSMALGTACAYGSRHLPRWTLPASLVGVPLLFGYGLVRNRPLGEWSSLLESVDAIESLRPTNVEFGGFLVVAEAMLPLSSTPETFPGYASALLQVIPRAILPDRPEAPAEWFIRTHFPDLAALGYGYGFNAIVESVANLGDAGPAIVGSIVGAALAWAGRGRVTAGLAVFLTAFLMRLDLASLLRSAILVAFAVAVVIVLQRVWPPRKRSVQGAVTGTREA